MMSPVDPERERAERAGRSMARLFRNKYALGVAPISDIVELLETTLDLNVAVLRMRGLEAMTRRDPVTGRMVIAVAASEHPERQRFSLAHELGHIEANDFTPNLTLVHQNKAVEDKAHAFARNLLAPYEGVNAVLQHGAGDKEQAVADIVRHFRVSPPVAAIQLRDMGIITPQEATELGENDAAWYAFRYGWEAEREGLVSAALRVRPPQRILARAIDGYRHGIVGAAVVARLRAQTEEETLQELSRRHLLVSSDAESTVGDDWRAVSPAEEDVAVNDQAPVWMQDHPDDEADDFSYHGTGRRFVEASPAEEMSDEVERTHREW